MATFLDIGFLEKFSVIFPFLLALVVIYGILSYSKLFGDNKTVHILIALFVSMMLLLSDSVRQIINLMAPWFVLLFLFMVFLIIIFKVIGVTDSEILSTVKDPKYQFVIWWFVAIAIVIAVGSLSSVTFKGGVPAGVTNTTSERSEASTEKGESAFWNTLFHPKILGLALIFLIAVFTISRLASIYQ